MESTATCITAAPMAATTTTTTTTAMIVATTVVTTLTAVVLGKKLLYPTRDPVIPSPLADVLSGAKPPAVEDKSLEYHPDEFPGARDVDTPYGPIRVYEFGPESGRKVLFIHGISTSCMTLTRLARSMASAGHRVLLFDLFGRGFSSAPSDLPHDSRLYTSQVLLALASSPLPWLGTHAMSVVGYSMGGALAVTFATTFPRVVDGLVLLAPAGLIRAENFGVASNLIFRSGVVPTRLLEGLTRRRLRTPIAQSVQKVTAAAAGDKGSGSGSNQQQRVHATGPGHIRDEALAFAEGETIDPASPSSSPSTQPPPAPTSAPSSSDPWASDDPLEQAVAKYVHWMLDHHQGFVPAFIGCITSAPLTNQHHLWTRLGELARSTDSDPEYFPKKVVVVLGRDDEIVDADDYEQDGRSLLFGDKKKGNEEGDGKVVWKVVGGGHNFPMTHANQALEVIYQAWGVTPPPPQPGCQ